jgi:hypothetical protein
MDQHTDNFRKEWHDMTHSVWLNVYLLHYTIHINHSQQKNWCCIERSLLWCVRVIAIYIQQFVSWHTKPILAQGTMQGVSCWRQLPWYRTGWSSSSARGEPNSSVAACRYMTVNILTVCVQFWPKFGIVRLMAVLVVYFHDLLIRQTLLVLLLH